MSNYGRLRVLDDVLKERDKQDEQWGGPAHDDMHWNVDWHNYIRYQQARLGTDARTRFVKIAALAIAALESIDRKEKKA